MKQEPAAIIFGLFLFISLSCLQEKAERPPAPVRLAGSEIVFLEPDPAVKLLATEDDYLQAFSSFDYAAKMNSAEPLDYKRRVAFYKKAATEWNDADRSRIQKLILEISPQITDLFLNLPKEILIIRTNGLDEAGTAYTRQNAIIFPAHNLSQDSDQKLKELFIHELFHIFSRHNKSLRDEIYSVINYRPCDRLDFPSQLKDLTIANPDAPLNNYYLPADWKGESWTFIPIIYSAKPYNLESGDSFFSYLHDNMLAVTIEKGKPIPILIDNSPVIVKKKELDNFYSLIGRNTGYTFHPEETMADNFVFLVLSQSVPDPWVVEGLRKAIFNSRSID